MKMEPRCGLAIGFYRDGGKIERERERERDLPSMVDRRRGSGFLGGREETSW